MPPSIDVLRERWRNSGFKWRERQRRLGRCRLCTEKAVSLRFCQAHLDRLNRLSREATAARPRFCPECLGGLPEADRKRRLIYHPSCGDAVYRRAQERYRKTEAYRLLHLRASKAYQARHRAAGLCPKCPRPSDGRAECGTCRANAERGGVA